MKKLKLPRISTLFHYRQFNIIFSVVVALLAWVVIVSTVSPDYDDTISGIPVNFLTSSSIYSSQDLAILGNPAAEVQVNVIGDRSVVGSLTAADFNVSVRYESVTSPGTYELAVNVSKVDNLASFDIVSVSPTTVPLVFDRLITKKLPIVPDVHSVVIQEGYVSSAALSSPEEITINGPESLVSKVDSATATFTSDAPLTDRTTVSAPIVLLDSEGNEILSEFLTTDVEQAELTIPVLKTGKLGVTIQFVNMPTNFDASVLKYELSTGQLSVAATSELIDSTEILQIGYVDLSTFKLDAVYEFTVELPAGFTSLDNVQSVTATFDTSALAERVVTVEEIVIVNQPTNRDIVVDSEQIQGVTLIGDATRLESLTQEGVIAEIHMSDITVEQGLQNVPVNIVIPSADDVFAIGEYTAVVNVQ